MSESGGRRHAPAEQLLEEWLAHHASEVRVPQVRTSGSEVRAAEVAASDPARDVLAALGVVPGGETGA
jgi:hypothetical protein